MADVSTMNVSQIVRAILLESSTLTDLTADRIFADHVLDADAGTLGMPSVIIAVSSGVSMSNRAVQFSDLEIYAYSSVSSAEAVTIYDLVYGLLQSERLILNNVSTRGIVRETSRPDSGYNDHLKAWFVRGDWVASVAG